jgi:hypothetical protein
MALAMMLANFVAGRTKAGVNRISIDIGDRCSGETSPVFRDLIGLRFTITVRVTITSYDPDGNLTAVPDRANQLHDGEWSTGCVATGI